MNAEQKELFRRAILSVLEINATRHGLPPRAIAHHLGMFGFADPVQDDVLDALDYLERRGLVEQALKIISRDNRTWRITQAGLALLDE